MPSDRRVRRRTGAPVPPVTIDARDARVGEPEQLPQLGLLVQRGATVEPGHAVVA